MLSRLKRLGRFGLVIGLTGILAYLVVGLGVVLSFITPPRLWVNSTYIGLLPYHVAINQARASRVEGIKLTFAYQDKIITLDPTQVPVKLTYHQSLIDYLTNLQQQSFKDRWLTYHRLLLTDLALQGVVEYDQDQLIKALNQAFDNYWIKPQPARLTYTQKRLKLIPAVKGKQIDLEYLYQAVNEFVFNHLNQPIRLKLTEVDLTPNPDQLAAGRRLAQQLIKQPISLQTDTKQVSLTSAEKVSLVSLYGGLDHNRLVELVNQKAKAFNQPPVDALFEYVDGRVKAFRPSQDGFQVDTAALINKLNQTLNNLAQQPADDKIIIPVTGRVIKPKITTQNSNSYGIKELVGQGESWFVGSIPNRVHNIALAAGRINGVLIAPGEVFSFNQYLGEVSARTGYRSSYVIKQGKTILDDGGGVCQVSTTLFRAVLNAGLPIIQRRAHSYRVSYYEQKSPVGLDATVFAPYVDFKFKNDLDSYLLIQAKVDTKQKHLVFSLYGTRDGRQVTISKVRVWDQSPPPDPIYQTDPSLPPGTTKQIEWPAWGAKAAFDWTVTKDGQVLYQKTFFSAYKPWAAVYLVNP